MCRGIVIIFKDKGCLISDRTGLCTEGASTTTGCRRRFAPLFKNENPFIISERCSCNKLAFISGQAANSVPYLIKQQAIINKIYKYYKYFFKKFKYSQKHSAI